MQAPVVVVPRFSCPGTCGIFLDQGSNPWLRVKNLSANAAGCSFSLMGMVEPSGFGRNTRVKGKMRGDRWPGAGMKEHDGKAGRDGGWGTEEELPKEMWMLSIYSISIW